MCVGGCAPGRLYTARALRFWIVNFVLWVARLNLLRHDDKVRQGSARVKARPRAAPWCRIGTGPGSRLGGRFVQTPEGGDLMSDVNKTVVSELAELVASLDHEGTETRTGLRELIDNGVRHVAGSHYAGIGLAGPDKVVTNVVATHRYPMVLDAIQDEYKEGGRHISASRRRSRSKTTARHPISCAEPLHGLRRWCPGPSRPASVRWPGDARRPRARQRDVTRGVRQGHVEAVTRRNAG